MGLREHLTFKLYWGNLNRARVRALLDSEVRWARFTSEQNSRGSLRPCAGYRKPQESYQKPESQSQPPNMICLLNW